MLVPSQSPVGMVRMELDEESSLMNNSLTLASPFLILNHEGADGEAEMRVTPTAGSGSQTLDPGLVRLRACVGSGSTARVDPDSPGKLIGWGTAAHLAAAASLGGSGVGDGDDIGGAGRFSGAGRTGEDMPRRDSRGVRSLSPPLNGVSFSRSFTYSFGSRIMRQVGANFDEGSKYKVHHPDCTSTLMVLVAQTLLVLWMGYGICTPDVNGLIRELCR